VQYLLFAILSAAYLIIFLRWAQARGIDLLTLVAANYVVCLAAAFVHAPATPSLIWAGRTEPWFVLASAQGVLFILMFWLIGIAARRIGLGYTALVTKMSVVVPACTALFLLGETFTWQVAVGITLALAAIILTNWRYVQPATLTIEQPDTPALNNPHVQVPPRPRVVLLLGSILFVGTGIVDTNFKLYDVWFATQVPMQTFTGWVFAVAGLLGLGAVGVRAIQGSHTPRWRDLGAAVLLGVPNYLSLVFLLKGLAMVPAARFFPASNIGQMLVVTLVGIVFYRESLGRVGVTGLLAALAAIGLLAGG
jgi:drug/metabolite transporter (DMT)-like permease